MAGHVTEVRIDFNQAKQELAGGQIAELDFEFSWLCTYSNIPLN